MEVLNKKLMQEMRDARRCHLCGRMQYYSGGQRVPMHPHHITKRGTGGGSQLDLRENLMGVHWDCHDAIENGHVALSVQWACIAAREKRPVEEIIAFVNAVLNAPKEAKFQDGKLYLPATHGRPGVRGVEGLSGSTEIGNAGSGG